MKTSYKKLAMIHHPDRNPGNAQSEEKFKTISEAYRVLSNSEHRKMYDASRSFRGGPGRSGSPGSGGAPSSYGADANYGFGQGGSTGRGDFPPGYQGGYDDGSRFERYSPRGGQRVVRMTRNDSEQLFRDIFGQGPLDQIFRDFANQHQQHGGPASPSASSSRAGGASSRGGPSSGGGAPPQSGGAPQEEEFRYFEDQFGNRFEERTVRDAQGNTIKFTSTTVPRGGTMTGGGRTVRSGENPFERANSGDSRFGVGGPSLSDWFNPGSSAGWGPTAAGATSNSGRGTAGSNFFNPFASSSRGAGSGGVPFSSSFVHNGSGVPFRFPLLRLALLGMIVMMLVSAVLSSFIHHPGLMVAIFLLWLFIRR